MKNYILLLLSFYSLQGLAQSRNPDSLRAKRYELKVKTMAGEGVKLPFESIKIMDSRFDTSKLGFGLGKLASLMGSASFFRILLKPGIEKGIESFYNQYYQPAFTPNGKTLLISIKKLWIDNMPVRSPHSASQQNMERASLRDIYAKFEFYIGSQNGYVPLVRVDTVFQLTPLTKVDDYDRKDEDQLPFLCFALEEMVENVNFGWYMHASPTRKEMTLAGIESYNAKMKSFPILTQPVKQGVFLTFDEFKNNLPSVTSFTKRKLRKTNITELVDKNDNVILHYYACYDGTTLRIGKPLSSLSKMVSPKYDILYRVGNSFQLYDDQIVNNAVQGSVTDIHRSSPSIPYQYSYQSMNIIPRQLDLETGEFY